MATKIEINEILSDLQEERTDIISDIISARHKCTDCDIEPKEDLWVYDMSRPLGYRSVCFDYEQMNADQLDSLCGEIEEQVELLQNYFHLMQALAYNQRKAEEWAQVEPDEEE